MDRLCRSGPDRHKRRGRSTLLLSGSKTVAVPRHTYQGRAAGAHAALGSTGRIEAPEGAAGRWNEAGDACSGLRSQRRSLTHVFVRSGAGGGLVAHRRRRACPQVRAPRAESSGGVSLSPGRSRRSDRLGEDLQASEDLYRGRARTGERQDRLPQSTPARLRDRGAHDPARRQYRRVHGQALRSVDREGSGQGVQRQGLHALRRAGRQHHRVSLFAVARSAVRIRFQLDSERRSVHEAGEVLARSQYVLHCAMELAAGTAGRHRAAQVGARQDPDGGQERRGVHRRRLYAAGIGRAHARGLHLR